MEDIAWLAIGIVGGVLVRDVAGGLAGAVAVVGVGFALILVGSV